MARHQRKPKGKSIKPAFFVFCEGESEKAYISLLKSHYRVHIEIFIRVTGSKISQKYISQSLKRMPHHEKDKLFLLYDLDVPRLLEKLQNIKGAILLVSNPCFELWYILHYLNQTAEITSQECLEKLGGLCSNYKKGFLCTELRNKVLEEKEGALSRAKRQILHENPSTSIYKLIDELEKL
jgi:RloB-like protein